MSVAVVYHSQTGHTEIIAREIADELGTQAFSTGEMPAAALECDVLFLGGAPYLNVMPKELRSYAKALRAGKVGRVVLFTTSGVSRRTILGLRKILQARGIPVDCKHFFACEFTVESRKEAARAFARKHASAAGSLCFGPDVKAIVVTAASIVVAATVVAGVAVGAVFASKRFGKKKS